MMATRRYLWCLYPSLDNSCFPREVIASIRSNQQSNRHAHTHQYHHTADSGHSFFWPPGGAPGSKEGATVPSVEPFGAQRKEWWRSPGAWGCVRVGRALHSRRFPPPPLLVCACAECGVHGINACMCRDWCAWVSLAAGGKRRVLTSVEHTTSSVLPFGT